MQTINHFLHTLITPVSWQCVNYYSHLLVAEPHDATIGEDCKYVKSSMFPWLKLIRDCCLAVVNTLSFNWQVCLHLPHLFHLPCPHLHLCVKTAHLPCTWRQFNFLNLQHNCFLNLNNSTIWWRLTCSLDSLLLAFWPFTGVCMFTWITFWLQLIFSRWWWLCPLSFQLHQKKAVMPYIAICYHRALYITISALCCTKCSNSIMASKAYPPYL